MGKSKKRYTEQTKFMGDYKGYEILKVHTIYHAHQDYRGYWYGVKSEEDNYTLRKNGKRCSVWLRDFKQITDFIDDVIAGKKFCYTNAEMRKYVYGPNYKNDWGFSQKSLIELFDKWKRATPRIKYLYEERLEDANFHSECDVLSTQGYDAAVEYVKTHW